MTELHAADTAPEARRFEAAITAVARILRRRRLVEGLALTCLVAALAGLGAAFAIDAWRFAPDAVRTARVVFYILVAGALAALVLPVLLEPFDRRRLASMLEARDGHLDALLLSASDALDGRGTGAGSAGLKARLWTEAGETLENRSAFFDDERRRVRRAAGGGLGALALALALVAAGPPGLRHAAQLLWWPAADPAQASPYVIEVAPGDIRMRRGADRKITAAPVGFRPHTLWLYQRPLAAAGTDGGWQRTAMRGGEAGARESILLDVRDSFEYYVGGDGVESARHRVDVVPLPEVSQVDLLYRYPARTGRAPERVVDGGDIRAVQETAVEVTVTPSVPVEGGVIRLDDDREIPLEPVDGGLAATLDVREDGFYRVELPAFDGVMVRASRDYRIDAVVDARASVRIEAPGTDIDVTSIEEVDIGVTAYDDVALRELALVVWVNSEEEEIFRFPVQSAPGEVRESLRLFLEDRDVEPGDLVAYHARANDVAGEPGREVSSDIYFMQVRPFDRRFSRAPGGGGAGGGGGGQSGGGMLAAQQRQLVIALFRLQQQLRAERLGDGVVAERIGTLSDAQARIRDRVEAIVRRLGARRLPGIRESLDPMLAELPKAADAMVRVEALLEAADIDQSLEQARTALRHLQRADAGYRDMQVAMSRGGGGESANDLTNLFKLEMDRFQSRYEHVQRGQWEQPERQLDEALRKLAELARRQQRELERSAATRDGAGSEAQDELAAMTEALMRELERLTRNRTEQQVADALDAAREAARAMDESSADGRREALDKLREAERALRGMLDRDIAGEIGGALRRAESLLDRQGEIERGIESLAEDPADAGRLDAVMRDKLELGAGVRSLDDELERLAGGSGRSGDDEAGSASEKAISDSLERAREALSRGDLEDMLAESRARLGPSGTGRSGELEEAIRRTLEETREALADAHGIAEGGAARRGESSEALRDLVRAQDRLQQALREGAREAAGSGGQQATADAGASSGTPGGESSAGGSPGSTGGENRVGATEAGGAIDSGVAMGGRAAGGWNRAGLDMADARRLFRQGARRLETLRGVIDPLQRQRGEIDAVVDAMRRLAESGADIHALLREHAAVVSALKDIERDTREGDDDRRRGVVAHDPRTPGADYREVVEEYYRRLSEAPDGA